MDPFSYVRDCFSRAVERRRTLFILALLFVVFAVLGACFARSDVMFEYNQNACARFIDRVCYSDTSVFVLFLKRTAGHAALFALVLLGGLHPVTMLFPMSVLLYRAFAFGGSLVIFFTVYGVSGAVIVFVLYLPIHLLIDAALLLASSCSFGRCRCSLCREEIVGIALDFLCFLALTAIICLVEAALLFALFHPLGNIL